MNNKQSKHSQKISLLMLIPLVIVAFVVIQLVAEVALALYQSFGG